jgi:hypothetical protein
MADHLRDQIITAVATLVTGLTTTSTRVFIDEDNPLEDADLPGITILQIGESTEAMTLGRPREMQGLLDLEITAYAKRLPSQADVRKQVNTICKEVQIALANTSPGGAKYGTLVQTDFELYGDAEKPAGMARMRWQFLYRFDEDAPDVAR